MKDLTIPQEAVLICKKCGFNYLHQERIEIFDRTEDESEGLHIHVEGGKAMIDRDISNNPSARRQGVSIFCICEGCHGVTRFDITQHKGNTYIESSVADISINSPRNESSET